MGCAKSVPQANQPKQVASVKVGSKSQGGTKTSIKHNQVQSYSNQKNDYRDNNEQVSDNNSDNESISSRKNKTNRNSYAYVQNQKSLKEAQQQQMQNNATNIIEEDRAANDNEELLLQQKLQENQNKFIQNLKFQDSQQELTEQKQDFSNMFQNDISKTNNQDSEDNKENIYIQSNNHEQHIPTLSTKAFGKQESSLNENYCNILRQQSSNTNVGMMNSGITMIGSINMLNSGQRLQNSNIVTSGLDFEKKKRDLIRKVSDDIDEIDEIDENNYQFGASKKEPFKLKNEILKTKKVDSDDEDEDNFFKSSHKPSSQKINPKVEISQSNNQGDDDDF